MVQFGRNGPPTCIELLFRNHREGIGVVVHMARQSHDAFKQLELAVSE
jgi:hypothetical protein